MKVDPNDVAAARGPDGLAEALDDLATHAEDLTDTAADWERPVLFGEHNLPTFPTAAFPSWLCAWVKAEAEATQTPEDLAGMLSLSILAAAVAKRVEIQVKPGWHEPLNLFTVTVLPPGNRKSAVFREAAAPLEKWEYRKDKEMAPEISKANTELEIKQKRLRKLKDKAAKDGPKSEESQRKAIELAKELEGLHVPIQPRIIADDVTPEKLASLLAEQEGRMAVLSAEGGLFETLAGRYSGNGAPNFDVLLKGHAGDTLRVDRVSRPSEYVLAPALTLGLAVQPDVLEHLSAKPGFRGRGLLARILYALPVSTVGHRKVDPPPVPETLAAEYARRVYTLAELKPETDAFGEEAPHVLRMTPDAREMLLSFMKQLEPRLAEGADLGHLGDWAAKLAGAVARIAGLLHLAEHWTGGTQSQDITADTVAAALRIGEYLIPHARAAFDAMDADPRTAEGRRVVAWLRRERLEHFTERDLYRKFRTLSDQTKRAALLGDLIDRAMIRPEPSPPSAPGRTPSPAYEVNPQIHLEN